MDDIRALSFEAAFAELEQIIAQLDSGKLALDESVTLYERARALSQHCQTLLDSAELRITRLNDDGTVDEQA
jgi:exodeoxyribonuclease VII small subunit